MTRTARPTKHGGARRRRAPRQSRARRTWVKIIASLAAAAAIAAGVITYNRSSDPTGPLPVHLPPQAHSYLGVYTPSAPASYAGVRAFAADTGVKPDVVMYYSGWFQHFPVAFAKTAAAEGAVPLVQMDPDRVSVADVASGRYDGYLSAYAEAVRAYHDPVIVSFGHEMNGNWYPWGYTKTSPAVFVAAWRHIVGLFRALDTSNVTWLWTVNIVDDTRHGNIPSPAKWWPGSSYVTWVGIDGYYLKPSWKFAPLFGPTIAAVRAVTADPILIAETGAVPASGQPQKIGDLFAGIRSYGLLGFVWFNSTNSVGQPFGISSPASIAAFRNGASTFGRPG
jgi:mannan endo-1,4-beta-mannosidase